MKQVRLFGIQDLRIVDVPMPEPGPHDVVVKIAVFGICGSDLGFARDGYIGRSGGQPLPLGHELVGTLHIVGDQVQDLRIGDRVVVHPMKGSNRIGTGDPEHGGFAEYLLVRDARLGESLFVIQDFLDFNRAVLTEPVAVGMHGLNQASVTANDTVVVFGAGPIGLGVIASLRYRKISKIVAVDVTDERLERARLLGAEYLINPAREDLQSALASCLGTQTSKLTGLPLIDASVFIDCAGHGPLLEQMVQMASDNARILVLATHKKPVQIDMVQVLIKEISLIGSLSYPVEFPEVIEMLSDKQLDISAMTSHCFAFEHFDQAFAMAQVPDQAAKVIVRME
jgi:2-desacetyl-2-hydroxyethyl bacteriochlorophyllide A dehydrogenase